MSSIFPKTYVIVMIFPVISCFPANCQVWKEKEEKTLIPCNGKKKLRNKNMSTR